MEKWGWKLTWYNDNDLVVKFPNGTSHSFDVDSTSAYIIKKWYEASQEEQVKIKVHYEISGQLYDKFLEKYGRDNYEWLSAKPNIPSTWSIEYGSGGGGSNSHFSNYTFYGPLKSKEKVIASINKFYEGFNYKIN